MVGLHDRKGNAFEPVHHELSLSLKSIYPISLLHHLTFSMSLCSLYTSLLSSLQQILVAVCSVKLSPQLGQ